MKSLTIFLFLFPFLTSSAQDTRAINFSLDTLRVDSFFLIETTTFQATGAQRPSVHEVPLYFTDTTAFNLYIEAKRQRLSDLDAQKLQIGVEFQEVTDQITALENLRDSVFRGATGFGFLRQIQPVQTNRSTFSTTNATSWLIYPDPKGKEFGVWFVPYTPEVPVKNDGFVLKPDGTFERVRKNIKKNR